MMADCDDTSSLLDEDSTDSNESISSFLTKSSPTKRVNTRKQSSSLPSSKQSCSRRNGSRSSAQNKNNLLQKLHHRQLFGKMKSHRLAEESKLFSKLPGRLAFFIRDAVPHSALTSGHVFLGFSRCGQFLVSYTQTNTENEQFDLSFNYYYRYVNTSF